MHFNFFNAFFKFILVCKSFSGHLNLRFATLQVKFLCLKNLDLDAFKTRPLKVLRSS